MSKGQSLNRAIKRGNAAIYWNSSTMQPEIIYKKGTPKDQWRYAVNRMGIDEEMYKNFKETQEASVKEIMDSKEEN